MDTSLACLLFLEFNAPDKNKKDKRRYFSFVACVDCGAAFLNMEIQIERSRRCGILNVKIKCAF